MNLSGKKPFHPDVLTCKLNLRRLRLDAQWSMNEGAAALGMSRKTLEDLETHRPYGSYPDWEIMCRACDAYGVKMTAFCKPLDAKLAKLLTPKFGKPLKQGEYESG